MGQFNSQDERFMQRALEMALRAERDGEVPVGAVVAMRGEVVGAGWNCPIFSRDPTAHAEIVALRKASQRASNYRLPGATLYVTLEPCVMCAGALVMARVQRLVFGARDIRFGGVRSKFALADSEMLNHRVLVEEGLMAAEAGLLLSRFFQAHRSGPAEPAGT